MYYNFKKLLTLFHNHIYKLYLYINLLPMASQNLLGALAIATAAHAAPANAAPENVSQGFADTNKATVIQVLEHQDSSIQL